MNLREARFKKNLTQIELSVVTGLSPSKISLIERGYYSPRISEVENLEKALEMPTGELEFKPLAELSKVRVTK